MLDGGLGLHPARILIVEDDIAVGGTIRRYLRQYSVEVTDCIAGALHHLERRTYDLVLLDRRLPDGLGDTVIAEVRKRQSSVPIIMMSGEIELAHPSAALRSGADDFIEKPFVREALVAKIERLLTSHALRTQASRQREELAALHARHEREVEVARTIFDRIFARGQFDPAKVRHLVLAADRLAGDVVFGAPVGPDIYRWMIGDVTGHTLSSALVTMPLAGIFYRKAGEQTPMVEVLDHMERELAMMLPANMFCAAAMCELDRGRGMLRVWNGGNPDVLIRHVSGAVTQIPSAGSPLAADRYTQATFPILEQAVVPGDRIYAFSDGLIELRDRLQQMIGFDRLLHIARTARPEAIFGRFLDCIPDYTGAIGYDDDISLVEVIV
jgi:two-component system, HptB-dependent secretion and biofilm response regulator